MTTVQKFSLQFSLPASHVIQRLAVQFLTLEGETDALIQQQPQNSQRRGVNTKRPLGENQPRDSF